MADLRPKPEDFKAGKFQLSARDLNKITAAVVQQIKGLGVNANFLGDRLLLNTDDDGKPQLAGPTNYMKQFVVLQEFPDYLLCSPLVQPVTADGTASKSLLYDPNNGTIYGDPTENTGAQVYVAKPYYLQQTPWNGRAFSGPADVISYLDLAQRVSPSLGVQTITPLYIKGDVILAAKTVTGLYDTSTPVNPIVWMDQNAAGRTWSSVAAFNYAAAACTTLTTPTAPVVVSLDKLVLDPSGVAWPFVFSTGVFGLSIPTTGWWVLGCAVYYQATGVADINSYLLVSIEQNYAHGSNSQNTVVKNPLASASVQNQDHIIFQAEPVFYLGFDDLTGVPDTFVLLLQGQPPSGGTLVVSHAELWMLKVSDAGFAGV